MVLPSVFHEPVLFDAVIKGLNIKKGHKYIDATLGGGGYTWEIVRRGGIVLGIDVDREAIEHVKNFKVGKEIFLERGNFAHLKKIAEKFGFVEVSGIIFDLGMSSFQIERSGRGFSFEKDEPLDMRMNRNQELTAADIINRSCREELYEIFSKFAEELHSRAVADAIFRARTVKGPIKRTGQLVDIVRQVIGKNQRKKDKKLDKRLYQKDLARIFQALRIVVNKEIENLKKGLLQAVDLLQTGGRLAVLSYHSLEDRLVKLRFKQEERSGNLRVLTKQPIRADRFEVRLNRRARSAKLRIAERIHE